MTVSVSIYDHETGETEKVVVPDGDYLLIVTDPATEQTTAYANGTHVITVKGRLPTDHSGSTHASGGGS